VTNGMFYTYVVANKGLITKMCAVKQIGYNFFMAYWFVKFYERY